jgi:hypothetical protein
VLADDVRAHAPAKKRLQILVSGCRFDARQLALGKVTQSRAEPDPEHGAENEYVIRCAACIGVMRAEAMNRTALVFYNRASLQSEKLRRKRNLRHRADSGKADRLVSDWLRRSMGEAGYTVFVQRGEERQRAKTSRRRDTSRVRLHQEAPGGFPGSGLYIGGTPMSPLRKLRV